jgi:hypothetical protein
MEIVAAAEADSEIVFSQSDFEIVFSQRDFGILTSFCKVLSCRRKEKNYDHRYGVLQTAGDKCFNPVFIDIEAGFKLFDEFGYGSNLNPGC